MLYYIQRGDTLTGIATRFGTTVGMLQNANLICNPNLIVPGQILIIPRSALYLPRAGAGPYYVVQPGDTLYCLSINLGIPVQVLAQINQLQNPDLIYPGMELLVINPTTNDPRQLKLSWEQTPDQDCQVFGLQEFGIYYLGSFEWAGFGGRAVRPLLQLLRHRCDVVRMYAAMSLGRLALNGQVTKELSTALGDPAAATMARIALRRIELAQRGIRRIHILFRENVLLSQPLSSSSSTLLPAHTEIIVLRWNVPSPTGEEGPRGGIQIYDYVQVTATGQTGFIPRLGLDQITFI